MASERCKVDSFRIDSGRVGTGDSVETGAPVGTGAPDAAGAMIFLTGEPLQGLRQGLRRNSPAGGSSVLTLEETYADSPFRHH